MILTQCAVCATELGLTLGKKCGRCSTRYCGPECQVQHWKEGGHDKLCKPIKKAGGAEQYNANRKYSEAVAVAAEKCAEDTKGQTCFICTQALHWKTKEGLVRGCSCRGTAGIAHVSCLVEQAKILCDEAEENNLGHNVLDKRFHRWDTCGLCEQDYHGVVSCALGWACWKTYLGRAETDKARRYAMSVLGNGLHDAQHYEEALFVREAELCMERRLGDSVSRILGVQGNLALVYQRLGRFEQSLRIERDVYRGYLKLGGQEHEQTLQAANNYADSLIRLRRFEEAKSLLRETMPVARRVLGENHEITLKIRWARARTPFQDPGATLDELREAMTTLAETERIARRVFGGENPFTVGVETFVRNARDTLAAREGDDLSSVCDGVAAMTPGGA